MENETDPHPRAKRKDVGYKRPPVEHQFKPGQRPAPRKKHSQKPASATQLLTMILSEERRLKRGSKARWYTNAFLLIEVAFQLAEKGNSTVARLLAEYMMAGDKPEVQNDQPLLVSDPDGESGVRTYVVRRRV